MPSGIPDGCSERLCGFLENPHKPLSRRRNAVLAAPGSSQKNSRPSRGDLRARPICSAKGVNLLFTITAYETHAFWLRLNMEWAPVAEHIGARFIFGRAYILASARPKPRASARATSLRHWRHAVIANENARLSFANERASWKSTRVTGFTGSADAEDVTAFDATTMRPSAKSSSTTMARWSGTLVTA
jgi:hypothetical protein